MWDLDGEEGLAVPRPRLDEVQRPPLLRILEDVLRAGPGAKRRVGGTAALKPAPAGPQGRPARNSTQRERALAAN